MKNNIKENINVLKYQVEKLDNSYKTIIDNCNNAIKIIEELQFNIQDLEQELKKV